MVVSNEEIWHDLFCRRLQANGMLPEAQVQEFEERPGWVWRWSDWDENLFKLYGHLSKTPHMPPPGSELNEWVNKQQKEYFQGRLRDDQIEYLTSIDSWKWNEDYNFEGLNKFAISNLQKWWVSYYYFRREVDKKGLPLSFGDRYYIWWHSQRRAFNAGMLYNCQIAALNEVSKIWAFSKAEFNWERLFDLTFKFYEKNKRLPQEYESYEGEKVASWLRFQRRRYKSGTISKHQLDRLEKFPTWSWEVDNADWETSFTEVKTGQRENKNWQELQRELYKSGQLEKDRIERLESIQDWSWDPDFDEWLKHFSSLKKFNEVHSFIPLEECKESGKELPAWCKEQRILYIDNELSEKQILLLEGIQGWVWDQEHAEWLKDFEELNDFIQSHKRLPEKSEKKLHEWYSLQVMRKNEGKISPEQFLLLDAIPVWQWYPDNDSIK